MEIRPVRLEDAEQIAEIYNHYILNTHHTFETEPLSTEEMRARIAELVEEYPYLVAEDGSELCGYAHAGRFKLRQAYKYSAEVSIYVKSQAKQKGVGTALYQNLFKELRDCDIHTIIAGIALPNDKSIKFHEKLGFRKVAHFRDIGYKLGRWIDVGYWQLMNQFDDE